MADLFSVSQPTWTTWEKNTREPNLSTIITMCNKFNVTSDWLLGLEETPRGAEDWQWRALQAERQVEELKAELEGLAQVRAAVAALGGKNLGKKR